MSDTNEQKLPQGGEEILDIPQQTSLTAEDRGEVEQNTKGARSDEIESNGIEAFNDESVQHQAQTNGHARQEYDLPIRNKESEHTEKVVSSIEEDPANLEPNGVVEKDQAVTDREEAGISIPAVEKAQELDSTEGLSAPHTTQAPDDGSPAKANDTTPAKSPHVPTYLKSTASASSKASPKASPARNSSAKTPQSISKLNNNLRKASATKPASTDTASAKDIPADAEAKVKSPVRAARLSHLTAPTAASSAKKDVPPPAAVQTKPLGRATSVRSKKPVEGSHFLAPTASSALRKDLPQQNTSSTQKTTSKRTSLTNNPAQRKVSASTARPPPAASSTTAQPGSRVPSGSSSGAKPASGSFLDRMTRPTAASAGHKADAIKSPSATKSGAGLGRIGSVRSKVGGAADAAKKKLGGSGAKEGERKQAPARSIVEESVSTEVGRNNAAE